MVFISIEKKYIIISYEGPESKGKEDLYFSQLIDDKWTAPVSMGPNINSSGYEISPFLSDNDTLFCLNGFGGYGDADILCITKWRRWDSWSTPVNLGEVINSPKFDAYFTILITSFIGQAIECSNERYLLSSFKPIPPLYASAVGTDATVYQGSDGKIDLTPSGGVPHMHINGQMEVK